MRRTSAMSESSSDHTEPEAYMNQQKTKSQDSTFTPVTHWHASNGNTAQLTPEVLLSYFRRAPAEDLEYLYNELNNIILARNHPPDEV